MRYEVYLSSLFFCIATLLPIQLSGQRYADAGAAVSGPEIKKSQLFGKRKLRREKGMRFPLF